MHWSMCMAALAVLQPGAAWAQDDVTPTASDSASTHADQATNETETRPVWIAGVSGGLLDRDGGPTSPYGTLSLTRYQGNFYLRGALTAWRGTVQQVDAALPSHFYVGSLGAGGNWNDWVFDAFASYGHQDYGQVETPAGKRASQAGSGSPYRAVGIRAGHVFRPAPRWYVTPTLGLQYAETKSLRHRIDFLSGQPQDFQLREKALTGNAALRIDRTLGTQEQHYVSLSLAHYETDNGLTSWRLTGSPGSSEVSPGPTPDSWQEIGLSGTFYVGRKLWLDTQAQRTFGAVAGGSTTLSLGLRFQF
ncbi:MAG: autotransporter outer membrane beta-barrel domain-containing protein [Sphingobium sp.]